MWKRVVVSVYTAEKQWSYLKMITSIRTLSLEPKADFQSEFILISSLVYEGSRLWILAGNQAHTFFTFLLWPWRNKIMLPCSCDAWKKRLSDVLRGAFSVLQLTKVRLFSKLPAKPLHGLPEGDLGLGISRPLLLAPDAWHGVHHAHLGSCGCRDRKRMKSYTSAVLKHKQPAD